MSEKHVALVAETERELAERFTHYGIDDPQAKAEGLVRWLQRQGWRCHPSLADKAPPATRRAPSAVAKAELSKAREAVEAKRGHRPELGDRCTCRGCVETAGGEG